MSTGSPRYVRGIAGAPGVTTGTVRYARMARYTEGGIRAAMDTSHIGPGDVLITAELVPEFVDAAARVAALIGYNRRGAILDRLIGKAATVGREVRCPAVVGLSDPREWLFEGDTVVVDGTRGVVVRR